MLLVFLVLVCEHKDLVALYSLPDAKDAQSAWGALIFDLVSKWVQELPLQGVRRVKRQ